MRERGIKTQNIGAFAIFIVLISTLLNVVVKGLVPFQRSPLESQFLVQLGDLCNELWVVAVLDEFDDDGSNLIRVDVAVAEFSLMEYEKHRKIVRIYSFFFVSWLAYNNYLHDFLKEGYELLFDLLHNRLDVGWNNRSVVLLWYFLPLLVGQLLFCGEHVWTALE